MVTEQTLLQASFAVWLQDDLSGQASLVDTTQITIKENGRWALRNPSGYYVFTQMPETTVTVRVETKYYVLREVSVNIPALNARNPVVAVTMKPNSLYPFPTGTTLVRGIVVDAGAHPLSGATVSVAGSAVTNTSEADGRFVLYWGPLLEDDISMVSNQRLLSVGGTTVIQLNVSHPPYLPETVTLGTLVEGDLKLMTTPVVLNL